MEIRHGGDIFGISRARGWDFRDVLDFSASINPLGPSPAVRPAINEVYDRISHYPEPQAPELRCDLAQLWNVTPEQVLLGNGATDLLHFYARTTRHAQVTLAIPTFSEFHRAYPNARQVAWTEPHRWPDDGLLVLTQPNSPSGDTLPYKQLAGLAASRRGPLLIDESFIEFTDERSALGFTALENVLVLRSLTKFYALPGVRIGALVASERLIRELAPRREPWQVSVLAEAAARAAVADREHAEAAGKLVRSERARMARELSGIPGLIVANGRANYLLVWCTFPAQGLADRLLNEKILIRVLTGSPGIRGEAFRIAIRRPEENDRLLEALRRPAAASAGD